MPRTSATWATRRCRSRPRGHCCKKASFLLFSESRSQKRCGPHPLPAARETHQLPSDDDALISGGAEGDPAAPRNPHPPRPARRLLSGAPARPAEAGRGLPGPQQLGLPRTQLLIRCDPVPDGGPVLQRVGAHTVSTAVRGPQSATSPSADASPKPGTGRRVRGRPTLPGAPHPAWDPPAARTPGRSRSRARGGLLCAAMRAARCGRAPSLGRWVSCRGGRPPGPGSLPSGGRGGRRGAEEGGRCSRPGARRPRDAPFHQSQAAAGPWAGPRG